VNLIYFRNIRYAQEEVITSKMLHLIEICCLNGKACSQIIQNR
jgi:hypothetical protein